MDIQELSRYFAEYGASFIFLIVLLEYISNHMNEQKNSVASSFFENHSAI